MICTQHCPRLSPCLIHGLEPRVPCERRCRRGRRGLGAAVSSAESSEATETKTRSPALPPLQPGLCFLRSPRPPRRWASARRHARARLRRLCSPHVARLLCFGRARMGTRCTVTIGSSLRSSPPTEVPYVSVVNKDEAPRWRGSCQSQRGAELPQGRGQLYQRGGPGGGGGGQCGKRLGNKLGSEHGHWPSPGGTQVARRLS